MIAHDCRHVELERVKQFVRALFGRKRKTLGLKLTPALHAALAARAASIGVPLEHYVESMLTARWLMERMQEAESATAPKPSKSASATPIVNFDACLGELLTQISSYKSPKWRLVRREQATGDDQICEWAKDCDVTIQDYLSGLLMAGTALELMKELALEQRRALEAQFRPRTRPRPACNSTPRAGV